MKRKEYFLLMIFLTALFIGCSSSSKLSHKGSGKEDVDRPGIINENFDPLSLEDDELTIKKTISVESRSDEIDDLLRQSLNNEEQGPDKVDGFRIQICAVVDEQKAKSIQREAILQFIDQNVYLKYDNPYYKVRVGDCLTRYEAEKLQKLAIEKGFTDAWVVRSKIKLTPEKTKSPQNQELEPPN